MSRVTFQMAKYLVERQGYLSDDDLADVLEANSTASLPPWLREYLPRHLRGIPRQRGRKRRDPAVADFALCWAQGFYERRLRYHQGKKLQDCDKSPSERAYLDLLTRRRVQTVFPNISWERLRNLLSANNKVSVSAADEEY